MLGLLKNLYKSDKVDSNLLGILIFIRADGIFLILQFSTRDEIIEFLENRGFLLHQEGQGFEIRIARRSLAGGMNEIFVGTDEIDAIGKLGRLETISCVKDVLVLKITKE